MLVDLSERPFVWLDTETTGLDPINNDVISIAIVRDLGHGKEWGYSKKLKMERPENAHPRALDVNGYTEEGWAGAADPRNVWQEIANRKMLSDCVIAGHNVRFDISFLQASFERHGIHYRVDYHLYDTVTLALLVLKPYVKSVSLVASCVALGIPVVGAHDALGDVHLAHQLDRHCREVLNNGEHLHGHFGSQVVDRVAAWEQAGKPNEWAP